MSELRAIELLEQLCPPMNDYALIEPEGRPAYFQRVQNFDGPITITGSLHFGGPKQREEGLQLRTFCDRLVEENEDALGAAIRAGELDGLDARLCVDELRMCEGAASFAELPRYRRARSPPLSGMKPTPAPSALA